MGFVAQLVWKYESKIKSEFSDLLNEGRWSDVILSSTLDGLPVSQVAELDNVVVMMLAHSAADYDIRFGSFPRRYPYRLLLLAKSRRDVECEIRRAICMELFEHNPGKLEPNALKITIIFAKELQHGKTTPACYIRASSTLCTGLLGIGTGAAAPKRWRASTAC